MKIAIKSLTLNNFKKISHLEINFTDITNISGENKAGKTTVFDAFTWLLFGKDSYDRKDFSIKTLTPDGKPKHRLEHEVKAVLDVDGKEETYRRIFKEKWVKKRGEETAELTGHETMYYHNDVPMSQNDYQSKVSAMLSESIAKVITSPLYFNSMKWNERREVLSEMAGDITDTSISAGNEAFTKLLDFLGGKSLAAFKAEIAGKKKKFKVDLTAIPIRIDELTKGKPQPEDYEAIETTINSHTNAIAQIDTDIENIVATHRKESLAVIEKQNDLNRLKMQLSEAENSGHRDKQKNIQDIENKIASLEREKEGLQKGVNHWTGLISLLKSKIESQKKTNDKLRVNWTEENAKAFIPSADKEYCYACKQKLPADKIEQLHKEGEDTFNREKANKLSQINETGVYGKKLIEDSEKENAGHEAEIKRASAEIDEKVIAIASAKERLTAAQSISVTTLPEVDILKAQIEAFVMPEAPVINTEVYKAKKELLQGELNTLKDKLRTKEIIAATDTRITELTTEEKFLAQQLASLERTEFVIDAFNKKKIEAIEEAINSKFKIVKWRMFSQNINGGMEDDCTCLVDGVPYPDVNTAGKTQAGLDIINALCEHYNTYAPIFIDNRESITEIPPVKSQVINLYKVIGMNELQVS